MVASESTVNKSKWNSTPQLSPQKPPSTPLVFALCRLLSLLILIFTSTTRNDELLHCSPDCSVTASANMKKLLDINTTRHLYRPTLPNQEMNREQSPVCLFVYGIKRMKLEWKKSSQLNKQPWLGIEPRPLRLTGRNALSTKLLKPTGEQATVSS